MSFTTNQTTSTTSSFFLLSIVLLMLRHTSPSMLVQVAPGTPHSHSLFAAPITSVRAFSSIGPASPYEIEFSSLALSAPLLYLNPVDNDTCPGCCSAFSPFSPLPLSPWMSSLVANRTIVLSRGILESCSPVVNVVSGFEHLHVALGNAGARAVIITADSVVPGSASNIVGSFISPSDKRAAKASLVPFVAVGSETGERLIKAVQNFTSPVHVTFQFDENRYILAYETYCELPFKLVSFLTHIRLHYQPVP